MTGTASIRWVRPALTTFLKLLAFRANERSSCFSAGSSSFWATSSAARWTAEGNTSLEDWPMLTWSLACTPSPARRAMTSLAFVFVEVPEPVWKTSIGNCSSCSPAAISAAAFSMRAALRLDSRPSSPLTAAAAPLMRASQWITGTGTVSPEMGKFSTALVVSPPHSARWFGIRLSFFSAGEQRPYPQKAASSRASPTGSS